MPNILSDINGQVVSLITSTIAEAVAKIKKKEIIGAVKNELVHIESRSHLKIISKAELIENYNR